MSDKPFVLIHNLINSDTGRTYKEDNLLLQHNIPVGALVEIGSYGDALADEERENIGIRLHVVKLERDCDGTPLYRLGILDSAEDDGYDKSRSFGGFPEYSLRVIDSA